MSCEIQLKGVRKSYEDSTEALHEVNLVCPRSKTTTLVGPSGSGKSTILKIIAGLIEPSAGSVLFDGKDVTWVVAEQRNIGMVFQSYALFPNMTIRENVEFGLLVRHISKQERNQRSDEVLETVGLSHLAERRIHQLSGGEQQRVALARAVVFAPQILLLDEPLSALDAKIRTELRAELARLLRQFRITAVYVTHDQQEAMSLGDQVVVLDKGCIMQVGSPIDVYARPANAFVANFIGSANLFDGHLTANGRGYAVKVGFGEFTLPESPSGNRWSHLSPGPVQFMCRPQDICISVNGAEHARVSVDEQLFLGDRIRVTAHTTSGERIQFETTYTARICQGDVVPIQINLENVHVIARPVVPERR
jgi:ABC-type Fe3+/spermidine/putrescine transport system ATPase subunit